MGNGFNGEDDSFDSPSGTRPGDRNRRRIWLITPLVVVILGAVTAAPVQSQGTALPQEGAGIVRGIPLVADERAEVLSRVEPDSERKVVQLLSERTKREEVWFGRHLAGVFVGDHDVVVEPDLVRTADGSVYYQGLVGSAQDDGDVGPIEPDRAVAEYVARSLALDNPGDYRRYLDGEIDTAHTRALEREVEPGVAGQSSRTLSGIPWSSTLNGSDCFDAIASSGVRWKTCYLRYIVHDEDPDFWYRAYTLKGSGRGNGNTLDVLTTGRSWFRAEGNGLLIVERHPTAPIPSNNCNTDTVGLSFYVELSRSYTRCTNGHTPMFPLLNKRFGVRHDTFSRGSCDPRSSAAALLLRIKNGKSYTQWFHTTLEETQTFGGFC
jgi:hypothetical protein